MSIAVIGSGAIGQRHAHNLDVLGEQVQLISMRAAGLSGVEAVFGEGVEAAIICTETQMRIPVIELAARHDIPVYIEKPVAFRSSDLMEIEALLGDLGRRSFVGYMMRYHPAVQYLAAQDHALVYRFCFEIGHDVTQWRQNWRFEDSYAAKPEGGGVLLDLCHEIDMAQVVLGPLTVQGVSAVGHGAYPGVDFSSQLSLTSDTAQGVVAMDYINPISTRRMVLFGQDQNITFDFANDRYTIQRDNGAQQLDLSIDRQQMFQNAMADFITLVRSGQAQNPIAPVFAKEMASCAVICTAYEQRKFTSTLGAKT
ncbi:hypothetical protein GCM10007939_09700 [Amylibacter marinus]|uniref:Uncharacterized protein n=1 Tax=Amylibacter marinus TaxID=1475483 RepID=A0ABQ5VTW2_9RHOB|nr:Gfo/Idh/MocA family oxidoreductase [Amylibacter marinus]GLQ34687.1 hypothetical protein GCM10007939_09700 [Amylibacter marinus]